MYNGRGVDGYPQIGNVGLPPDAGNRHDSGMDPELVYRPQALAQGFTDRELQRHCQRGTLIRVRPGAYGSPGSVGELDSIAKHRIAIAATVRASPGDAVVSHASLAVMYELPLWNTSLRLVHMTVNRRNGGKKSARRHLHSAPYDPDEVTVIDGVSVFVPSRMIVDLARTLPFEQAVVVGDAAMRKFSLKAQDARDALDRWPRRPGAAAARRAIDFMDPRSESPGESRSRVRMFRAGLPAPDLQFEVFARDGLFVGRTDFRIDSVLGEFDGESKYGRLLRPGQTAGDAVFGEKVREDGLRDTGAQMVRWTWSELDDFAPVAARWSRAIERGGAAPRPRWRL